MTANENTKPAKTIKRTGTDWPTMTADLATSNVLNVLDKPDPRVGVVESRSDCYSGALCFKSAKVMAAQLFDYLAHGYTVDQFVEGFPTVPKEEALAALRAAEELFYRNLPAACFPRGVPQQEGRTLDDILRNVIPKEMVDGEDDF